MTDRKHENIVIIGGGISGLSVARRLMLEGYRDILILIREKCYRGDPGHPPGGLIRHLHPDAPFRKTLNEGV